MATKVILLPGHPQTFPGCITTLSITGKRKYIRYIKISLKHGVSTSCTEDKKN